MAPRRGPPALHRRCGAGEEATHGANVTPWTPDLISASSTQRPGSALDAALYLSRSQAALRYAAAVRPSSPPPSGRTSPTAGRRRDTPMAAASTWNLGRIASSRVFARSLALFGWLALGGTCPSTLPEIIYFEVRQPASTTSAAGGGYFHGPAKRPPGPLPDGNHMTRLSATPARPSPPGRRLQRLDGRCATTRSPFRPAAAATAPPLADSGRRRAMTAAGA